MIRLDVSSGVSTDWEVGTMYVRTYLETFSVISLEKPGRLALVPQLINGSFQGKHRLRSDGTQQNESRICAKYFSDGDKI